MKIKKLFHSILRSLHLSNKVRPTGVYHNYTGNALKRGHNISVLRIYGNNKECIDATGHGTGIKRGDYLILSESKDKRVTRYIVNNIEYMVDPRDQWFAELEWIAITTQEEWDKVMYEAQVIPKTASEAMQQTIREVNGMLSKARDEYMNGLQSIYQKKEY